MNNTRKIYIGLLAYWLGGGIKNEAGQGTRREGEGRKRGHHTADGVRDIGHREDGRADRRDNGRRIATVEGIIKATLEKIRSC